MQCDKEKPAVPGFFILADWTSQEFTKAVLAVHGLRLYIDKIKLDPAVALGLIRLSVGVEDIEDLLEDLRLGLKSL